MIQSLIASRFKKYKPKTVAEAMQKCNVCAKFIGKGVFREVYRINHLPLVAKFPIRDSKAEIDVQHSQWEMQNIKWISRTKKFSSLWPHLPEFFHFDSRTGVSLMTEYEPLAPVLDRYTVEFAELEKKLELIDYGPLDVDQVGIDETDTLICLDFGHIGDQRRWWDKEGRFCLDR